VPAYKKQHYLPAAYLKYFSIDPQNCNRGSSVLRFDGKTLKQVRVVSQCSSDYFYSKEKAAETEKMFQVNENAYCDCVDRIRTGKDLEGRNLGDLLLSAFDFHLRNGIHKNRIGKEGIEAYGRRVDIFIGQVLMDKTEQEISKAEIIKHIIRYWRLELVSCPNGLQFLTSDHPSVWITLDATKGVRRELHLVTLPLTPQYTAIGFDRRALEIIGHQANADDTKSLNIGQIQNAERAVYLAKHLPPEQMPLLKKCFESKTASPCEIDSGGWKLLFQYLPPKYHFSFMRLRPPLM
jgi:uncharacterized protein DUF4238